MNRKRNRAIINSAMHFTIKACSSNSTSQLKTDSSRKKNMKTKIRREFFLVWVFLLLKGSDAKLQNVTIDWTGEKTTGGKENTSHQGGGSTGLPFYFVRLKHSGMFPK